MNELLELFKELDTDTLSVADCGIVCNGSLVTHIHKDTNGDLQIWAGDPNEDKHSEQLFVSPTEQETIYSEIVNQLS